MAIVAFSELPRRLAFLALANQKRMTPFQQDMARSHPHLFWVEARPPKRKRISKKVRAAVFDRDGGICKYCAEEVPFDAFTLDHIIPLSRGGDDSIQNLCVACRPCNCSKGAAIFEAIYV